MVVSFTSSFYGGIYGDWQTISMAAAALSILIAAMLIMFSRLFGMKNLEQVAKAEFVYAISTILIVIMAVGIIQLVEPQLANPATGLTRCLYLSGFNRPCTDPATFTGSDTLVDWMKLYMATPTYCVQSFMNVLYGLDIPIEAMASVYMEIFMSEHASGFGVKWISERIINTTSSLTFYVYMFFLMVNILNFIKYYSGFFFSIGVALRAFPPTRGAGAYLMAISFGLYFVFPLSYILIATLSMPHVQSSIIQLNSTSSTANYFCALPTVPDMTLYQCGAADMGRILEYQDLIKANGPQLTDMLTVRIDDLNRHLVSVICIFPMIAMVILLTFVLNTTNLFGGNIPEVGRGLVKLI